MMRMILIHMVLVLSNIAFAALPATSSPIAVQYYTHAFGNLHQNASQYSTALTTISCNHPVKVFEQKMGDWVRVQVANQIGYLPQQSLSSKQVKCFQDAYPRFFDQFELNPSELYYWGRLYDQYVIGKSRVQ